jgi:hypothetical protein
MPTASQIQVIDPILSNVALGYKQPEHVGMALFPIVPVSQTGGKIIQFGKEAFRLYNTARAPGGTAKRVRYGHEGAPYAVENHALDAVVPREWMRDAKQVPNIDLGTRAVNLVMKSGSLVLENQQATVARTAANYDANHKVTLAGTDQWSDYANSNPIGDVDDAKESVRESVGVYPNVIEISAKVFKVLKEHPSILDKIKYTHRGIVTAELLAAVFDVPKVVIGTAIAFDDADASIDVWGKDVVLAYVPSTPTGMEEPSYGYTYQMQGHPMVEIPYWDQPTRSWVYGMTNERVPVQTGFTSGFLITNAVA